VYRTVDDENASECAADADEREDVHSDIFNSFLSVGIARIRESAGRKDSNQKAGITSSARNVSTDCIRRYRTTILIACTFGLVG
jgi:hypothetical protein